MACIRSILTYATPVFYYALPIYLHYCCGIPSQKKNSKPRAISGYTVLVRVKVKLAFLQET